MEIKRGLFGGTGIAVKITKKLRERERERGCEKKKRWKKEGDGEDLARTR